MRLVTFTTGAGPRLGALADQNVIDLVTATGGAVPATLREFLAAGAGARAMAEKAVATAPAAARHPLPAVKLLAPILDPGKILCLAKNYAKHAAEMGFDAPKVPWVFAKLTNTVSGPYDPILLPKVSRENDYEVELAVVIGCRGKHIREQDAMSYVGGYTIAQDISVRDFQNATPLWLLGKNFDSHCPLGPALVTADEVPDPHHLAIRCIVSGEVLQNANTQQMIFRIPFLIAYLSQAMTLEPGDLILTGTPAGVGHARQPVRYLVPGDVVRSEIEGLGFMENRTVAEA